MTKLAVFQISHLLFLTIQMQNPSGLGRYSTFRATSFCIDFLKAFVGEKVDNVSSDDEWKITIFVM